MLEVGRQDRLIGGVKTERRFFLRPLIHMPASDKADQRNGAPARAKGAMRDPGWSTEIGTGIHGVLRPGERSRDDIGLLNHRMHLLRPLVSDRCALREDQRQEGPFASDRVSPQIFARDPKVLQLFVVLSANWIWGRSNMSEPYGNSNKPLELHGNLVHTLISLNQDQDFV